MLKELVQETKGNKRKQKETKGNKRKQKKTKKVGLVRFELTIDGYLRTTALTVLVLVSIYQCSNGSSLSCPVGKDSVYPLFIIYPLEPIAMPD